MPTGAQTVHNAYTRSAQRFISSSFIQIVLVEFMCGLCLQSFSILSAVLQIRRVNGKPMHF